MLIFHLFSIQSLTNPMSMQSRLWILRIVWENHSISAAMHLAQMDWYTVIVVAIVGPRQWIDLCTVWPDWINQAQEFEFLFEVDRHLRLLFAAMVFRYAMTGTFFLFFDCFVCLKHNEKQMRNSNEKENDFNWCDACVTQVQHRRIETIFIQLVASCWTDFLNLNERKTIDE